MLLVPGLAADVLMYEPQVRAFPQAELVRWIPNQGRETLREYAIRLAATVPGGGPAVLVGSSFGGFVVQEMVGALRGRVDVRGVGLISSGLSPCVVRGSLRRAAWLARWLPGRVLHPFRVPVATATRWLMGPLTPEAKALVTELARRTDTSFALWCIDALSRWEGAGELGVPVSQLHGERDRIMPVRGVQVERVVAGAGHLVNVTHAAEVNAFLAAIVQGVGAA